MQLSAATNKSDFTLNMKTSIRKVLAVSLLGCCLSRGHLAKAEGDLSLDSHLEPLRSLLGKTWKGTFKDSKPDKPVVDIARWERTLNGKAVRVLHSINEGAYGGETIFIWGQNKQTVIYYYFTTGGFMTTGTAEFKDGKVLTREVISGSANGITEVRATSEILPDSFHVKSEHRKNGEWVPGHEVTYREDSSAAVKFK
jgi:hypothetical protein